MKKRIPLKKMLILTLALICIGSLSMQSAFAQEAAGDSAMPGPADPITLRISTAANANETHVLALDLFKKQVESTTNNITVEIYHSASLFAQDANIPAMMRGNLEMALTNASWLSGYMPSLSMFNAAYLFRDYDHMNAVLNGEIGEELFDQIAETLGVRPLGAFFIGSRTINLVDDKEITCRADLEGIPLRVPNSASWIFMCEALGADPVPMSLSEVYLALQTGVVKGQDNPLPATMANAFGEVTKSITMTNHIVDQVWLAISESIWQSFDADTQATIQAACDSAGEYCDETNLNQIENLKQQFIDMGLSVYTPDVKEFKNEVIQYYLDDPEMSGTWDMELYDKIQAIE